MNTENQQPQDQQPIDPEMSKPMELTDAPPTLHQPLQKPEENKPQ